MDLTPHLPDELLQENAAGALLQPAAALHLAGCATCQATVSQYRLLFAALPNALPNPVLPPTFARQVVDALRQQQQTMPQAQQAKRLWQGVLAAVVMVATLVYAGIKLSPVAQHSLSGTTLSSASLTLTTLQAWALPLGVGCILLLAWWVDARLQARHRLTSR